MLFIPVVRVSEGSALASTADAPSKMREFLANVGLSDHKKPRLDKHEVDQFISGMYLFICHLVPSFLFVSFLFSSIRCVSFRLFVIV